MSSRAPPGQVRAVGPPVGPWFGTGPDRGIALVFVVAGIIGLLVTGLALLSRPYRRLSAVYAAGSTDPVPDPISAG